MVIIVFFWPKKASAYTVALLTLSLVGCLPDEQIDPRYAPRVESAAFYGANNAWLVTFQGELLKTDNGGGSWQTVRVQDAGGFDTITFIDERNGWAGTKDGQVLRSTDGGSTWVSTVKLGERRYGPGVGQIKFLDEMQGWIVHTLFFWRTEDGGATWQRYPSLYAPNRTVHYCFFIDPQTGWLSGSGGAVYRTQDGGKTWQAHTVVLEDRGLSEVSFVDPLVGWVAASPGDGIYNTQDGGKTWSLLPDPGKLFYLWSVHFSSKSEGWAAGSESENGEASRQKAVVLHTTNGGHSWARVKVAEDEPFAHRVYFTDSAHGWLLARDNAYGTDDGGKTWRVVLRLPPIARK